MPELDIQRREQGISPWVWVLGTLLLIGLIWWMVAAANDRREVAGVAPNEQVAGSREQMPPVGTTDTTAGLTPAEWLPLAAMRANPDNYFNQSISGMGTVTEVASDRGFWLEQQGSRVFVVKDPAIPDAPVLTAGQTVSIQGTVKNPMTTEQQAEVMALDEATRRMLQAEPAYIHATAITVQNS